MSRQPKRDLQRKQRRKKKVHYLRGRLEKTTNPKERQKIIAKIKKISPAAPLPAK